MACPAVLAAAVSFALTCAAENQAQIAGRPTIVPQGTIVLYGPGSGLEAFTTWLDPHGTSDPDGVFSIVDHIDGAPAIRISGQHFGGLITKESYADYRLTLEFRWGLTTWGQRKVAGKDSGILLHCQGQEGNTKPDFSSPWQQSVEFMIMEGATGDFVLVHGYDARGEKQVPSLTMKTGKRDRTWDPLGMPRRYTGGRLLWYGRDLDWRNALGYRGANDIERPDGQWNRLEVVCAGDAIRFYVNGVLVNEGIQCSLHAGRIFFQSEGAEIYFRDIRLLPLQRDQ